MRSATASREAVRRRRRRGASSSRSRTTSDFEIFRPRASVSISVTRGSGNRTVRVFTAECITSLPSMQDSLEKQSFNAGRGLFSHPSIAQRYAEVRKRYGFKVCLPCGESRSSNVGSPRPINRPSRKILSSAHLGVPLREADFRTEQSCQPIARLFLGGGRTRKATSREIDPSREIDLSPLFHSLGQGRSNKGVVSVPRRVTVRLRF
jgi:hypothetical protein